MSANGQHQAVLAAVVIIPTQIAIAIIAHCQVVMQEPCVPRVGPIWDWLELQPYEYAQTCTFESVSIYDTAESCNFVRKVSA